MGNIIISQRRLFGFRAVVALAFLSSSLTYGQVKPLTSSQNTHKTAGDVLLFTIPALAMGSTFIWQDGQKGTYQFSKALTGTLAVTYGLKLVINKERPNKENNYSFPSGHTSVAFASAAFVQKRYGWEYGIPAYLLAGYVGYTRIKATKHDGWDVLAGAAIGIGMSYLFTKPYDGKKKLGISSGFIENTPTIGLTYKF
ncbi:phosphatase PAP2 family protein [Maribacter sp. PR1]|uniref:Phosphatase PAP2 family protein n=1 Tax=Maribacter cobaltidurans TaxID=1178778 RepID=A0ABU7IYA6_9FLAO|nr:MULTISPECIES: phosphatase PAP2 family protein [Maribacter]MDC6390583.1 phosphatase PAP2 family protein [Maribacter sp. PR1]MEE1977974.1 phosphatase PAP2 family protein [Maribacter cobaltidurans]